MMFVGYGINAPERDWNDYAGANHYRASINNNHYRKPLPGIHQPQPLPDIHQQGNNYGTITGHPSTNARSSIGLLKLVDWMI
jgi:hypothetical protein